MSSARVNRPTSCSSWVIRSAEASDCLSAGSKRVAAFSRSCRFHFESCSSLRLCRRHTSAWELSLLRVSRTTSALNSGVKFLRFRLVLHRILLSSRWILYHNLVLESGPNFRWQYKYRSNAALTYTHVTMPIPFIVLRALPLYCCFARAISLAYRLSNTVSSKIRHPSGV